MSSIWWEVPGDGWKTAAVGEGTPDAGDALPIQGLRFVRFGHGADGGVALLAPARLPVRVNGQAVPGGFRVLDHRDEILMGRARLVFSAESTPAQVVFRLEGGARSPTCPICRGPVKEGEQAVRCPGCARWYHQLDPADGRRAKHCWTYSETCRFCGHPTALSGKTAWRPDLEETHA